MNKTLRNFVPILVLSVLLTACGDPGSAGRTTTTPQQTTTTLSNLGGDALPVQRPDEDYGHFPTHLSGELSLEENGCWEISFAGEERILIFPVGFTTSDDGAGMTSSEGTTFSSNDRIDLVGGITATEALPGVPDGFWGNYLSFCDATASEVVVADSLSSAYDPTALTDDEMVALVDLADLSQSWPCGLGFTVSSHDQHVALYVHPNDFDSPQEPPIVFPSEHWIGTVVIGKNLMVNHCDDVAEFWEPERVIAAEWPIIAGDLRFEATGDEFCSAEGPVTASLDGIIIKTPSGRIVIGDLSMVNEAFGCFAG